MREGQIRSAAFESAELQSERLRIFGVLGFVAVFILVTVVRVFIIRTAYYTTSWVGGSLLAAIIVTYESWALHKVRRTLNVNGSLPIQFWFLSTTLETSIPAFAIVFLKTTQLDVVYRYLVSPAVLAFFIFIILSTLRLNPWIAVLSGTVASISYLCATLYLGWRPPFPGAPAPVTPSTVSLNAITLFVGGLVAAGGFLEVLLAACGGNVATAPTPTTPSKHACRWRDSLPTSRC